MTDNVPQFDAHHHPDSDLLNGYISGDGPPELRAAIAAHLATCDACRENVRSLRGTVALLRGLPQVAAAGGEEFVERFGAAMDDDFGTPEAVAVLFEMVREVNRLRDSDPAAAAALAARVRELGALLGVLQMDADEFLQAGAAGKVDAVQVEALIQARLDARAAKNWAESDRIRDELTALGVVLEDGKGGTTWRLAE